MNRLIFNWKYFLAFVSLLLIELGIALNFHDWFVRGFLGDVLVVLLIYSFLASFLAIKPRKLALSVLIFSVLVEFSQFYELNKLIGLENNRVANVILGSTFDWLDLLAYGTGYLLLIVIEKSRGLL